jgi:hypothetical protein
MSKTRRVGLGIQSRARATIVRRNIEQIKTVEFTYCSTASGFAGLSGKVLSYSNGSNIWVGSGAGTGYNWNSTGLQYTIGNIVPNNTITFGNPSNPNVLVITHDGDVEWNGKPSEAAEALKRTFQFVVEDKKGITKAARRRYYLRACQNILNKAEKMEYEEFVAFLNKQVYNREKRVIMDSLKGEDDAG